MNTSKIMPLSKGFVRGKLRSIRKLLLSKSSLARKYLVTKNHAGNNSSYCYGIWIQQLNYWSTTYKNVPKVVVEIGSGNSLGVGLAALISGSEKFYSLERTQFWNTSTNLRIFDELVILFRSKIILDINEDSIDSINVMLNDEYMKKCLSPDRLNTIRQELHNPFNLNNKFIKSIIPWKNANVIEENTVNYIMSHTVLQHVDDLAFVYHSMSSWLKEGGCMSHTIDFKSMNATKQWNGHWLFNDKEWQIITGGTSLINREPYSTHIQQLEKYNFKILQEKVTKSENTLERQNLASKFQKLEDQDLTTSGLFYFVIR